jgi:hypothetical protein
MRALLFLLATGCLLAGPLREERARWVAKAKASKEVEAQLSKRHLPPTVLKEKTLAECVIWLNAQGIPAEITPELASQTSERRFTFTLVNATALEALQNLQFSGISSYHIEKGKVIFNQLGVPGSDFWIKEWKVPAAFFGDIAASKDPKAFFEKRGLKFPQSTWVHFKNDFLLMKHDLETLDKVDETIIDFLEP